MVNSGKTEGSERKKEVKDKIKGFSRNAGGQRFSGHPDVVLMGWDGCI